MKTTLYYPLALLLVSIAYASPLAAQSKWPIDSTLFDVARNLREQEFFSDVAYQKIVSDIAARHIMMRMTMLWLCKRYMNEDMSMDMWEDEDYFDRSRTIIARKITQVRGRDNIKTLTERLYSTGVLRDSVYHRLLVAVEAGRIRSGAALISDATDMMEIAETLHPYFSISYYIHLDTCALTTRTGISLIIRAWQEQKIERPDHKPRWNRP